MVANNFDMHEVLARVWQAATDLIDAAAAFLATQRGFVGWIRDALRWGALASALLAAVIVIHALVYAASPTRRSHFWYDCHRDRQFSGSRVGWHVVQSPRTFYKSVVALLGQVLLVTGRVIRLVNVRGGRVVTWAISISFQIAWVLLVGVTVGLALAVRKEDP